MKVMSGRLELASDIVDHAEALVRAAEADLAAASNQLARDICETRLCEALAMQDASLEATAPAIAAGRREVIEAGWAAIRSLRGDPGSDGMAKHRRWHSAAVKAWLIGRMGSAAYLRLFPW